MSEIQRTVLFRKLNSFAYKTLENATIFCKMRGNPYVEFIHWLHQIIQAQDSDFHRVIKHFGIDLSRLSSDVTNALGSLPAGASSISDISSRLDEIMECTWKYTTLYFEETEIRSGYIIYSILKTKHLTNVLASISKELSKIKIEELGESMETIIADSPEDITKKNSNALSDNSTGKLSPPAMGKQEALKLYATDLTEKALKGELDPVLGRDNEIRQLADILMRRRQNNPILIGDAGVGKTAIVEGFAQKISDGDVPPSLKNVRLHLLDIGLLQAGASIKGEFENRLKLLIEEVNSSPTPIILFIDEAHTLIGAGGASGTGDAANLLKPALARGTLRTIAATTWSEYKRYIEKDPALTRRFQTVMVKEPTEKTAIKIMRGLSSTLEKHHKVLILDEALETAVNLSHRYIVDRQLPDKAISLVDTTCARVAISLHSQPPKVESCQRKIGFLSTELDILSKEEKIGYYHTDRVNEIREELNQKKESLKNLEKECRKERALVDQILDLRELLNNVDENSCDDSVDKDIENKKKLHALMEQLSQLQGENPMILPSVDAHAIAAVVSGWTGIPVGKMVKNEIEAVLNLSKTLEKRVIGQSHALEAISKRIRTSRAGIDNPNKPIGVFMLAGPSGVGKTETALALADTLYGGDSNLITVNMSEFQEAHTVSTLKGAPPGYVGYGEGGVLTEAVRRKPYSVVLLDEIEKAHSDVHELFFQVFDKGIMEDGEGRKVDFKNTIILLTSNVGSELIMDECEKTEFIPEPEKLAKLLRSPLLSKFPAALLGRLVVVPYYPISHEMLNKIIHLQLERIQERLLENRGIKLSYSKTVVKEVISRCTDGESGARMVDAILTHEILPTVSTEYLNAISSEETLIEIKISVKKKQFVYGKKYR